MGVKRLADRLKIDPKKLKKQETPCFNELMRWFNAIKKVGYDADKCPKETVTLQEAIVATVRPTHTLQTHLRLFVCLFFSRGAHHHHSRTGF